MNTTKIFTLFLASTSLVGCGRDGRKTFAVGGRVEVTRGDVTHLAGSHVEAALVSDPTVRASGIIQSDGRFALETLHAGVTLAGAREGRYNARILLADDDRAARRRAAQSIAPRYLDFRTSGLAFDVPATGDVTITVSR